MFVYIYIDSGLPEHVEFADDVDFLSFDKGYQRQILPYAEEVFRVDYKLIINTDKTEEAEYSADSKEWGKVKKLGSLIGQEEDLSRRMQLAAAQFSKCTKLWTTKGISLKTRLRLYNALVIPVLMYNAGTWALTKAQSAKLDVFHRRHLRQMLRIRWPRKISNKKLYKECEVEEHLSVKVGRQRWSLFGHVLRLDEEAPARKAMGLYCDQGKGKQGRPKTTLPVVLWAEAKKVLNKAPKLASLEVLAQDRRAWWVFADKVIAKSYGVTRQRKRNARKAACASNRVDTKPTWVKR